MNFSLLQDMGESSSSCGYCKGPEGQRNAEGSFSHGVWAHSLTNSHYQLLIERGWRRSGNYLYRPKLPLSCCPPYTIRLRAEKFTPSKEQRKVIRRLVRFLETGDARAEEEDTSRSSKSREPKPESEQRERADSRDKVDPTLGKKKAWRMQQKALKQQLKRERSGEQEGHDDRGKVPHRDGDADGQVQSQEEKGKEAETERNHSSMKPSGSGSGSNSGGRASAVEEPWWAPLKTTMKGKAHTLTLSMTPARFSREAYELYEKYQKTVHRETSVTEGGYKNFLVNTALTNEPFPSDLLASLPPVSATEEDDQDEGSKWNFPKSAGLFKGYGTYHEEWRLDGKLVMVGVVDVLPKGLSSVYLFYDPALRSLSPGKLTALFELSLSLSLSQFSPKFSFYYMGFYIDSCEKMRYKAQYEPSELLCRDTLSWVAFSRAKQVIDSSPIGVERLSISSPPLPSKNNNNNNNNNNNSEDHSALFQNVSEMKILKGNSISTFKEVALAVYK